MLLLAAAGVHGDASGVGFDSWHWLLASAQSSRARTPFACIVVRPVTMHTPDTRWPKTNNASGRGGGGCYKAVIYTPIRTSNNDRRFQSDKRPFPTIHTSEANTFSTSPHTHHPIRVDKAAVFDPKKARVEILAAAEVIGECVPSGFQ